ncbi:hypothetical protein [Opitutus sp. ER46]|uniref:hypothetical protein n=1 Tax=Opitutus sp. ER46 TaxID=2161864 RepID=UPI000D3265C7|nr:hypothetical protein [Opitutus sp. ER46]PTX96409.1 hypothetical protein DB354_07015 [Opitutus sp. ER46]
MRLFEAILEVNRRRVAGDRSAFIPAGTFADALPVAALTCFDARLNSLLPDALGVPDDQFIWLRNAGGVITGPLSSTMRSLGLASALKGAREIVVIGHSDGLSGKNTMLQLLERFGTLGVDRQRLPENLVEYFGLFGSERQNVQRSVEIARASPLIGAKVPVHGLLLDLKTGALEWLVNGYQDSGVVPAGPTGTAFARAENALEKLARIGHAVDAELKLPDTGIGQTLSAAQDWLHRAEHVAAAVLPSDPATAAQGQATPNKKPTPASPLETLQARAREFAASQAGRKPSGKG